MKTIALVGSPNCGKTTLFNAVTGLHQHVGNWAGVTVERKEGTQNGVKWVDLPGVYALSPYSAEERVTIDYLSGGDYDEILQIVDATALARGLYLTHQLTQLSRPMTIALNMMDECRKRGITIDTEKLSARLGIRVLPMSARDGTGVPELLRALKDGAKTPKSPPSAPYTAIIQRMKSALPEGNLPSEFRAWKALEGDEMGAAEVARAGRRNCGCSSACRRRQRFRRFAMRGQMIYARRCGGGILTIRRGRTQSTRLCCTLCWRCRFWRGCWRSCCRWRSDGSAAGCPTGSRISS